MNTAPGHLRGVPGAISESRRLRQSALLETLALGTEVRNWPIGGVPLDGVGSTAIEGTWFRRWSIDLPKLAANARTRIIPGCRAPTASATEIGAASVSACRPLATKEVRSALRAARIRFAASLIHEARTGLALSFHGRQSGVHLAALGGLRSARLASGSVLPKAWNDQWFGRVTQSGPCPSLVPIHLCRAPRK